MTLEVSSFVDIHRRFEGICCLYHSSTLKKGSAGYTETVISARPCDVTQHNNTFYSNHLRPASLCLVLQEVKQHRASKGGTGWCYKNKNKKFICHYLFF